MTQRTGGSPDSSYTGQIFAKARQMAEKAMAGFVVASIYYLGIDPREASIEIEVSVDSEKIDGRASAVHPSDVHVSLFYTSDSETGSGPGDGSEGGPR